LFVIEPPRRHLATIVFLTGLAWFFTVGRAGMHPVHLWNRAFADAAYVLLCLTLAIGPVVRWAPRLWPLLPWRRELGIWATSARWTLQNRPNVDGAKPAIAVGAQAGVL
jgi:DMSO/TMAO reductase YedYZ heme-binding membrane subunit